MQVCERKGSTANFIVSLHQKAERVEIMIQRPNHRPLSGYTEYNRRQMKLRSSEFRAEMRRRRSVRHFSDPPVPPEVIIDCVSAATSAPSGANMQPWHFVVVSDPSLSYDGPLRGRNELSTQRGC